MGSLQIQDAFEPYYAGRDVDVWQGDSNDNRPTAQSADKNSPQRRRQIDLAARRIAMLAHRSIDQDK